MRDPVAVSIIPLTNLMEVDVLKELLLFNKLYNFFANQETELEFKFDDIIDL